MSDPFIGEIRMFAGNFAPRGWALCDGQILLVSQFDALFSLLGTTYGGDGASTFGLPDLRGRIPVHPGSGPGLSHVSWGERAGSESITISSSHLPTHRHDWVASQNPADAKNPRRRVLARSTEPLYATSSERTVNLLGTSVGSTGRGNSYSNLMPYQCVTFIIALIGIYPSRS